MGSLESPLFSLQDVPGKGKGLIASRAISPGTLLISETPLFTTEILQNATMIEQDLRTIIKSLPKDGQRSFLSLHNNFPGSTTPFSNIVRSNGYPLGPSSDIGGIFLLVSRLNHSCRPNAQHAWNEKLGRMLVHAVRDIREGEELTLSYIAGGPSTERKVQLKNLFTFWCQCEVCDAPYEERQRSDERLARAQRFDEAIGDPRRVRYCPEKALQDCWELMGIYWSEGILDLRVPRLYYDGLQIAAMHGDGARASVFARRAMETRVVCEGRESEEVENLRALAEDPERFENFGITTKWKSGLGDVPKGLSAETFERWLWRQNS